MTTTGRSPDRHGVDLFFLAHSASTQYSTKKAPNFNSARQKCGAPAAGFYPLINDQFICAI
jgi:hypothetical protein